MNYTSFDDNALLQFLTHKQSEALSVLYDRYGALVFSVAFGVVKDRNSAEEVTQDVFLRVWDHADLYDRKQASFKSWLTRIARNRAIDVLRKDRLRPERIALEWADPSLQHATNGKNPSHAVELQFEQERVRKAVSALPEEQGLALQLAFLQGYTHQEIATQLQTPLGTVKTRIRLGMKKLRDILQNP